MSNLSWKEAIIKVLETSSEALHYTEIAEAISAQGLRTEVGATPANSVAAVLTSSLKDEADGSPFMRVSKGFYGLRGPPQGRVAVVTASNVSPTPTALRVETQDEAGLINAFGMYWVRDMVLWRTMPRLLGQQQPGSQPVDFCGETGVYLLHDGRSVVYVGRTTEQPLGVRLRQHTTDRLNGRWDRFSWFGTRRVKDDGSLDDERPEKFTLENLIATMEALLIEGLEPPQNRKRGDDFRAVEFLQSEDPEIRKARIVELMDELKSKL